MRYEIGDNSVRTKIEGGREEIEKKKRNGGHVLVHGGVQLGQIFLSQILVTYRPVRCQAVCNASIFFVFCFVFHFLCACALYEGGLVNISFFVFFLLLFVKISYVFAGSACVRIRPPKRSRAWRLASECGPREKPPRFRQKMRTST